MKLRPQIGALEALGIPLTLAILPDQDSYMKIHDWAVAKRHDVFVTLPMEPQDMRQLPPAVKAEDVLTMKASPKAMADYLDALLKGKAVLGVASRMGSAFTQNVDAMEKLLLHLKQRGLVFLDALTTGKTVTEKISQKVLALSLRRHLHWDQVVQKFDATLKTHKRILIYVPLKSDVLKKPEFLDPKTTIPRVFYCHPRLFLPGQ